MLYNDYKNKMIKAKKLKNIFNIVRWPLLGILVVVVITLISINSIKGKAEGGIEINSSYVYGEEIEPSCDVKMSKVLRYEYKFEDSNWTTDKPLLVGDYEVRAISKGLFGDKVAAKSSFEITKADLTINVEDKVVVYGSYPKASSTGLLNGDTITSITYTFDDITSTSTMANMKMAKIEILNTDGIDVTSCYNITSNASDGCEVTFSELSLTLEPNIGDKVYDGKGIEDKNKYIILYNKEAGFNDIISVETTIKNSNGEEVSDAIEVGSYEAVIKTVYINGSNVNPNYNITTVSKTFEITKRDLNVETKDASKVYDGVSLSCDDITLNNTLAEGDSYAVISDTKITNASRVDNVVGIKIVDSNNNDRSDCYNITYSYGTLEVLQKDILIKSKDASKTYDGLQFSCGEIEEVSLVGDDEIIISDCASVKNVGTYENKIAAYVVLGDGTKSNNYNITYSYGTLEVLKRDITIKPLDENSVYYNGEAHNYTTFYHNYDVVEGSIVDGDDLNYIEVAYSNALYSQAKYVGTYEAKIISISEDMPNYNVKYENNTFEILKANITIAPIPNTCNFDYGNYTYNLSYQVKEGVMYDNIDLKLNVHFEQDGSAKDVYDVGIYNIVIDSYESDSIYLSNYDISYATATLEVLKKDVEISLNNLSKTYDGNIQEVLKDSFSVSDERIKNNIKITKTDYDSIDILNSGEYTINILEYSFTNDDKIKESNYNIKLIAGTYTILKRNVIVGISYIPNITYNGEVYEVPNNSYYVVEGSFINDDTCSVEIIDKDNKEIKNAGTYNLIINSISCLSDNYIITSNDESKEFVINPYDVSISIEDEEYTYDSLLHTPDSSYTLSNSLFNNDLVSLNIKTTPQTTSSTDELRGAGTYKKYFEEEDIIFTSGGNDSIKSNYNFIVSEATITINKREISIKPDDCTQNYYIPLATYNNYTATLLSDGSEGVAQNDTINITTNYDEESALALEVGSYQINVLSIERISNLTNTVIDYSLDYIINLSVGTLSVIKRDITIAPECITVTYDKTYKTLDSSAYVIYDYDNTVISELPGNQTFTLHTHFELYGISYDSVIDANTYTIVIDSLVSSNENDLNDYNITLSTGHYAILKRDVTVKAKDQSVTYDGDTHSPEVGEIEYVSDNEFIDSTATYEIDGDYEFINSGTYDYNIKITELSSDKLDNYNITYETSTFKILRRRYTIQAYNASSVYDGNVYVYDTAKFMAIESDGEIRDSVLIDGTKPTITVGYSSNPLNVGTYYIYIKNVSYNSSSNFIFEYYSTNVWPPRNPEDYGVLEITPRKLTVTLEGFNNIYYDGLNHLSDINYKIVKDMEDTVERIGTTGYPDTLISMDIGDIELINAGTYEITLNSISFGDNITVEILDEVVECTILRREISIKPLDQSSLYDASVKSLDNTWEYTLSIEIEERLEELDKSNIIVLEVIEVNGNDIINAGTYNIKINSISESDNYNVSYDTTATYTVNKRDAEVILDPIEDRVYNTRVQIDFTYTYKTYDSILNEYFTNSFMDSSTITINSYEFYLNDEIKDPKDVGTYTIKVSSYIDNPNFNITFQDSTLTILKRDILVNLENQSKAYNNFEDNVYDGAYTFKDLNSIEDLTALPTSLDEGAITYNGIEAINVGSYSFSLSSAKLYDSEGIDITSNYNIEYSTNTYTITKRDVEIILSNQEKKYDGLEFVYGNVEYNNALASIDYNSLLTINILYKLNGVITIPIEVGEYIIYIDSVDGDNLILSNHNFITSSEATLTIDILSIKATLPESYNMIYGASVDINSGITYTYNDQNNTVTGELEFMVSDTLDYSLLNAGEYDILRSNLSSYKLYYNSKLLNNDSIEFSIENDSKLIISKRNILVGFIEIDKTYDGIEIETSELKPYCTNILERDSDNYYLKSILINNDEDTKILHVGTYTATSLTLEYINSSVSFEDNYNYSFDETSKTIAKIEVRDVVVEATINEGNSKVYNGVIDKLTYTIRTTGNLDDDILEFSDDFSYYLVGTYTINITLDSVTGISYVSDYNATTTLTYEITKKDITITSSSDTFTYDGSMHNVVDFTSEGLASTDNIVINSYPSYSDAGVYENTIDYLIYNNSVLVDSCYNITLINGSITINKNNITIYSIGGDFTYDGASHIYSSVGFKYDFDNNSYEAKSNTENLTYNNNLFVISKTNESTINYVGSILDEFEIEIKLNSTDVTYNFDVEYVFNSYITVSKKVITIDTISSLEFNYNGTKYDLTKLIEIKDEDGNTYSNSDEIVLEFYTIKDSDEINYSYIKDANTYYFTLAGIKFTYNSLDVTNNYDITYNTNTSVIVVNKLELKLTTTDRIYIWDGEDKYDNEFSVYDVTNKKDIATYDKSLDKTTIDLVEGSADIDSAYLAAYDSNGNKLLTNSITNSKVLTILDSDSISLMNNYVITYEYGTMSYSDSYSFKYNQEVSYNGLSSNLTEINGIVTCDSVFNPQTFSADISYFLKDNERVLDPIDVGVYDIVIDYQSIKVICSDSLYITYQELLDNNISLSYDLTYEITAINLLYKIQTTKFEYNGTTQSLSSNIVGTAITDATLIKKYDIKDLDDVLSDYTITFYSNLENSEIGLYYATLTGFKIIFNNLDVTSNFNLLNLSSTFSNTYSYMAKLQITLRNVNVLKSGVEVTYDGESHSLEDGTYDTSNLLKGHTIKYVSEVDPGYYSGAIVVDSAGKDVSEYYKLKATLLKINRIKITIETSSASKDYDGSALYSKTYSITSGSLRDLDYIVVSDYKTISAVGSAKNILTIVIYDSDGNNVSNIYQIKYTYGTLEIK